MLCCSFLAKRDFPPGRVFDLLDLEGAVPPTDLLNVAAARKSVFGLLQLEWEIKKKTVKRKR